MDQLGDLLLVKPKRSTFLTVLCILSFLGSGYAIFSGIIAYTTADKFTNQARQQMKKSEQEIKQNPTNNFSNKMLKDVNVFFDAKKIQQNSIASIVCNLITLLGALLMFKMNRKGFVVYVLGTVAGVVLPLLIFGNNSLAGFLAYIPGFFGLVFIAMYAFQLKDMKMQPLYD